MDEQQVTPYCNIKEHGDGGKKVTAKGKGVEENSDKPKEWVMSKGVMHKSINKGYYGKMRPY